MYWWTYVWWKIGYGLRQVSGLIVQHVLFLIYVYSEPKIKHGDNMDY